MISSSSSGESSCLLSKAIVTTSWNSEAFFEKATDNPSSLTSYSLDPFVYPGLCYTKFHFDHDITSQASVSPDKTTIHHDGGIKEYIFSGFYTDGNWPAYKSEHQMNAKITVSFSSPKLIEKIIVVVKMTDKANSLYRNVILRVKLDDDSDPISLPETLISQAEVNKPIIYTLSGTAPLRWFTLLQDNQNGFLIVPQIKVIGTKPIPR